MHAHLLGHLGNTLQAFSLVGLVNTARPLAGSRTRTDAPASRQHTDAGNKARP